MVVYSPSLDLVLDPAIRNWVVIPLVFLVLLINLARNSLLQMGKSEKALDLADLQRRQILARCGNLKNNSNILIESAFGMRRAYFTSNDNTSLGVLKKDFDKLPGPPNPMSNPASMMDGMKSQAAFMVTQLGMNQFGEAFFSGFVLVKVPFPLTNSFKPMLQRGVNMLDLKLLSSSYVTATSWMFLVSFGMRDLQKLLLGDNDALADQEARQLQMQMGMGMNQMGFDAKKAYKAMTEQLDMIKHEWNISQAEKNLLGDRYPTTNISATDAFLNKQKKDKNRIA